MHAIQAEVLLAREGPSPLRELLDVAHLEVWWFACIRMHTDIDKDICMDMVMEKE